ncbi:DNA helicase II [Burkholderia pseudomallei]|uniref:ATP-dependent helicase n=1 Tax=Burkholderia pseudomallei TaxID=28450 RepID=UPI000F120352|nr:ATP-dependent helicase [Burkholderia pseudomallei]CAJ4543812.1 DNA helicase II [Burkholderia pseudomallei]CAJ5220785.1 DNA helicase II [Burkholderia pseudomallei]CAJ6063474.1 DNA helicase II [Burkholderia pseudomallei]VBD67049.1 DNA helicase II [Burkholderia pseudomallei]VBL27589.1 DNA helicase II [Burkholderia pseudomallei]
MNSPTKLRLSTLQAQVVEHVDGALLVVAGPGSGKTRVLTERVRSLLTSVPGHFRVLALTFTNKAADEMRDRLSDLGENRQRAFIGTLHSFCLEMLVERGKLVGVEGEPHIFEQHKDRKEILLEAIRQDPVLDEEVNQIVDRKERNRRVDNWLQMISRVKAHPITCAVLSDELDKRVLDAYDAGLRACGAYDFDDLLLLGYRLLTNNPKLADFYRRLYRFVCVDEAQDLNEAQYALLCALCGDSYKNVMMVGDPKQSIYGFNTSSPEYMEKFRFEFAAKLIELTENFRSSQAVVNVARSIDPNYLVDAQLPIKGDARVFVGDDEEHEARLIVDELELLFAQGHPDVEGGVEPSKCAILGRTRFALLAIENELRRRNVPFYKRLTANHENESDLVDEFHLSLRILANPRDRLHLAALATKWVTQPPETATDAMVALSQMAQSAAEQRAKAVAEAVASIVQNTARLDLMPAFKLLRGYADSLDENSRRAIYEDVAVFQQEWDQYLRSDGTSRTLSGFMSSKALGATQKAHRDGVALLTVHSSKGLEFDAVFIAGMAEGTFPDYRAVGKVREMAEESRNAFVAVTRSKRLLYLTYPRVKLMPWGDYKAQQASRFVSMSGIS